MLKYKTLLLQLKSWFIDKGKRMEVKNTDIKISRIIPCGSMKDRSALWKTFVNDPDRSFIWKDIGEVPYIEFDFLTLLEKPTELRFN